jgi:spore maturation protein CgeB
VRLLLLDSSAHYPSNPLFLEAAKELGQQPGWIYEFVDEAELLVGGGFVGRGARRLLRHPLGYRALNRALIECASRFRPDIVLVCKGAFVSPVTLASIKAGTEAQLLNYATDDPFNPINNTRDLVESIPLYDLYACTKRNIMRDVRQAGSREVIYVSFGYKPSIHFPEPPANTEEAERFNSDVVFIGGGDQDRFPYLRALVGEIPGLNLHLYGGYWDRDPALARYHRGFAYGREFRLALSGAKIALNLVRHANRDGHVMRTFEIPACGAFMLAERTEEHLELFSENEEAAYFESADEMVDKVRYYLGHDSERRCIAEAGHRRVVDGRHTYGHRLVEIIKAAELTGPRFRA